METRPERSRLGRRAFLSTGAAGLLAGCADDGGGDDTPTGTTKDATTTRATTTQDTTTTRLTTTAPDASARLGEAIDVGGTLVRTSAEFAARHSLLTAVEGFGVVVAPEGRQYAFAAVEELDGDPPARSSFALTVGDQRFEPRTTFADAVPDGFDLPGDYGYDPGRGLTSGWVGFEVPAPLPGDASVALELTDDGGTGRWTVPPASLQTARAPPPSFELVGVEVPASVPLGEPFRATVTLRNAGDGDGTALVVVAEFVDDEYVGSSASTVDVGAGGELSVPLLFGTLLDRETATAVRLVVRTSGGDTEATVPVEGV